jgi:hypothetical protein
MATFKGIRGVAQAFVRSAAQKRLGADYTLRALREAGMGYRRTDFLRDYREYAEIPAKAERIKYVRHDYRPSRDLFVETVGKQRTTFRYQVEVDVFKPETGETFTMTTNVASDVQLTIGQATSEGIDALTPAIDKSQFEIPGYRVTGAFHKEGEFWD